MFSERKIGKVATFILEFPSPPSQIFDLLFMISFPLSRGD